MSSPVSPPSAEQALVRMVPVDPSARRRVLLALLRAVVNVEGKGR